MYNYCIYNFERISNIHSKFIIVGLGYRYQVYFQVSNCKSREYPCLPDWHQVPRIPVPLQRAVHIHPWGSGAYPSGNS